MTEGTKWSNPTPEQAQAFEDDNSNIPVDPALMAQIEYSARQSAMQAADRFSANIDELLENANRLYGFLTNS